MFAVNRVRLKSLSSAFSVLLALCFITSACARKDYGALKQNQSSRTQQQVYADLHAPLRASHQLLTKTLPQAKAKITLFALSASGAKPLKRALRQSDLWDELVAVFIETPKTQDPANYDLYYFDPRAMRIQQIERNENDKVLHIVRSVPVKRKPTFTQNELDVFLFSFKQQNQQLRGVKSERLTDHLGNNIMPIVLADKNTVLYTSVDADNKKHIMQTVLDTGDQSSKRISQLLIDNPAIESSHPRLLSDGSIGIIANPDGYFRAHEFDWENRIYFPTSKRAASADNGDLLISTLDGRQTPLLLQIPSTLDLETLQQLAGAHNTSVNRYRALLAAALIEARRSKLAVLPSLNFGVYYTPVANVANGNTIASGDFLAQGISRGIFGIVQDIFSIPKHLAMSEAQIVRAEIARDTLLNEINQRQAEVADLFFQAQMYQQLLDIDKTLLDIVREQRQRQQRRQDHGVAISVEVMGFANSVSAVEKRLDDHRRRLALLLNEIKDLCGLPLGKQIKLHTEIYLFEKDKVESFQELKQMALLNNPRIQAARRQLEKAFFEQKTGGRYDAGLKAGVQYGRSHEQFGEFLDEFITININGEVPLGAFKDKNLHQHYWQEIKQSQRLAQEQESQNTLRALQRNLTAFYDSRNNFEVQQQSLAHTLEQIRLARIFKRYPLVKTAYRSHSKDLPQARELYYQTLTETLRQHAALAQYYTRVWRDMGLAGMLPQRLKPIRKDVVNKQRFSTWVWNGHDILSKNNAINEFIKTASTNNVRRAYIYLEADDKVLADPLLSERLNMLINRGASKDIEVWALVGSKDNSDPNIGSRLQNSARNIERYNQRFKALEPRIGGMKIHLRQAGSTDLADQKQYQRVLEQTRALLPKDLPLWIDVPLHAFSEENAQHISDVLHLVDGVTVHNPNGKNQQLLLESDTLLELSPAAVEFALQHEQSEDGAAINDAIRTLQKHQLDKRNFAGIALLDWSHILREGSTDDEEDE